MTKEELEKEAKVFATYYESLFPDEFETFYKAFLKVAEPREEHISELEKENGNLEGKLADWQSEYIELENFKNNEVNELKAQLTKAKGIITNLVEDLAVIDGEQTKELKAVKEAVQFLKEIDK